MVKFRMKPSKATEICNPATMSAAMTESPSHQKDLVEDVEKTESMAEVLAEAQIMNEAASARASFQTRPRTRADLGTGRGREKAQLSCNTCRQRK